MFSTLQREVSYASNERLRSASETKNRTERYGGNVDESEYCAESQLPLGGHIFVGVLRC